MATTIDHIADELRNIELSRPGRPGSGKRCNLLIGAGCSVTAGIPTAKGLVEAIANRFPSIINEIPESDRSYGTCMGALSIGDRNDLIREFVAKCSINWAHLGIATLVASGYVDRIFTTNFDPLIARACALSNIFPAVYDLGEVRGDITKNQFAKQSIIHLHGQNDGFKLRHTSDELEAHGRFLKPLFRTTDRVWIVVGYSGSNDPLVGHIVDGVQEYRIYWVARREDSVAENVRRAMAEFTGSQHKLVSGYDADSFFVELCQRLDSFPPRLIAEPFQHLLDIFKQIGPFSAPGVPSTNPPGQPLGDSADAAKGPEVDFAQITSAIERARADWKARDVLRIDQLYIAGKYKEIVQFVGSIASLQKKDREPVAYSLAHCAEDLIRQYVDDPDNQSPSLLEQAQQYLTKFAGLGSVGRRAHERAAEAWIKLSRKMEDTGDKVRAIEESLRNYDAAINYDPEALGLQWRRIIALSNLARWSPASERPKLFADALEQVNDQIIKHPQYGNFHWTKGCLLEEIGDVSQADRKPRHLEEAISSFEMAVELDPDDSVNHATLARALESLASFSEPNDRQRLLKSSIASTKRAMEKDPQSRFVNRDLRRRLELLASLTTGEEADKLRTEAAAVELS